MLVISIENQKGGTAKTTTAVSLAAAFGEDGIRVLVIDLDEQCSATSWFGVEPEGKGSYAIIAEGEPAELEAFLEAIESAMRGHIRGVRSVPETSAEPLAGFRVVY